ncbi:hypothetical protein FGU46_01985 [Methanobacterium sp. CWC-01]|nr:hypothetical protein FGU46_01985 [Methanobacterium sp. CWC-01]
MIMVRRGCSSSSGSPAWACLMLIFSWDMR